MNRWNLGAHRNGRRVGTLMLWGLVGKPKLDAGHVAPARTRCRTLPWIVEGVKPVAKNAESSGKAEDQMRTGSHNIFLRPLTA